MKNIYNNLKLYFWSIMYIVTKFYYLIIPIITLINLYYSCDIYLCDNPEGILPKETNWSYESEYKPVEYQPYRPGLQYTSEGYRYEADSRPVNYEYTSEGYRYYADGRPVDNHPYSYDSSRRVALEQMYSGNNNPNVGYNPSDNQSDSTKIGFIGGEPSDSFINEGYFKAGGVIYPRKPAGKPGLWNWIKDDIRKTRQKVSNEKINKENIAKQDPFYGKSRAEKNYIQKEAYKVAQGRKYKSNSFRNDKVRRFD